MTRAPGRKLAVKKKRIRRLAEAELDRARGGTLGDSYYRDENHDHQCSFTFGGGRGNHNQGIRS